MSDYQHVDVSQVGDVAVVRFQHDKLVELDVVAEVNRDLGRFVQTKKPNKVLLSFAGVRLVSSAGLAAVLSLIRRLKGTDSRLKFCAMSPVVREIFAVTELDKLFDIEDDEAAGLRAFSE
jgi:anti-sigma B factor antagonist